MKDAQYEVVGRNYDDTSQIPKDMDILYLCTQCGCKIPSVPRDNLGCNCGNVFIDRDCWKLVVADMSKLEVIRIVQ